MGLITSLLLVSGSSDLLLKSVGLVGVGSVSSSNISGFLGLESLLGLNNLGSMSLGWDERSIRVA